MENGLMFIIGTIIFILYMVGYVMMIKTQHGIQARDRMNDPELNRAADLMDMDGHGNWGRFVPEKKKPTKKRLVKSRKKVKK